jgi:hypothetical protein
MGLLTVMRQVAESSRGRARCWLRHLFSRPISQGVFNAFHESLPVQTAGNTQNRSLGSEPLVKVTLDIVNRHQLDALQGAQR